MSTDGGEECCWWVESGTVAPQLLQPLGVPPTRAPRGLPSSPSNHLSRGCSRGSVVRGRVQCAGSPNDSLSGHTGNDRQLPLLTAPQVSVERTTPPKGILQTGTLPLMWTAGGVPPPPPPSAALCRSAGLCYSHAPMVNTAEIRCPQCLKSANSQG